MRNMKATLQDGIHGLVPYADTAPGALKMRDIYDLKPNAPLYQCEFGYYCLDRWKEQGMPADVPLDILFGFDPPYAHTLGGLGGCEGAFCPQFDAEILEDRGELEVVRDAVGRHVLCFKGRRSGFMPQYLDHPVKDMKSWVELCKWRLDPETPERYFGFEANMQRAVTAAGQGLFIRQVVVGGYMYLRSLMGPERLLYKFYDEPELINDCMTTWFELADAVLSKTQKHVSIDEILFDEDICYNHGTLISPDMIREFLFPYYQQLLVNIKKRQLDQTRRLYPHLATDGRIGAAIPLYMDLGFNKMSPFEVASGCDVIALGTEYPDLIISGGVDKRELAKGRVAIDKLVNKVFPTMRSRGGYIPTCDHGVPEEVSYEDYLYYRKRCLEFA